MLGLQRVRPARGWHDNYSTCAHQHQPCPRPSHAAAQPAVAASLAATAAAPAIQPAAAAVAAQPIAASYGTVPRCSLQAGGESSALRACCLLPVRGAGADLRVRGLVCGLERCGRRTRAADSGRQDAAAAAARSPIYCETAHQHADWRARHKLAECGSLKAQREQSDAASSASASADE